LSQKIISICSSFLGEQGKDPFKDGLSSTALIITSIYSKSQLAIEYAFQFREQHPLSYVLWISASTTQSILQAYKDVARRLNLPGHDDPKADACQLVV
jgi:hypothetical protein